MRFLAILLLVLASTICQAATPTGAANWTASGTTNANLKGVARINSLVASNSITLNGADLAGQLAARSMLDQPAVNISASDIDLVSTNRVFGKELSADTVFTFSNLANGQRWMVILTNGASWTVTWPTVTWMAGSAPVMDTGAGVVNTFVFQRQGGVTFGDVSQKAPVKLSAIEALANGAGALVNDGSGVFSYVSKQDTLTAGTGIAIGGTTIYATNVVENAQTLTDNSTNDVSITKHGYAPKAPNDATKFLDGTGAWTVPAGGATVADPTASQASNAAINGAASTAMRSDAAPALSTSGVFQFGRLGLGNAASGTSVLSLPNGTVGNPSIINSASDDNTGTGIYWDATDSMSLTANGAYKLRIGSAVTLNATLAAQNQQITQMGIINFGSSNDIQEQRHLAAWLQLGTDGTQTPQYFSAAQGSGASNAGSPLNLGGGVSTGTAPGGALNLFTSLSADASNSVTNNVTPRFHAPAKYVALTHDTATEIIKFSLAANKMLGGEIVVTTTATNSTPHLQARTTVLAFQAVAVTTTITATIDVVKAGTLAASSGTLTETFTIVDNTDNTFSIKLQANSDLSSPTERCRRVVTALNGNDAVTITDP